MSTAIKNASNTILYSPTMQRPIWDSYEDKIGEETISNKIGEETISTHRIGLTIQDPSLYRRITALFWTITNNMWVSLGSLIGASLGVRLENDDTDRVEDAPHMTGQDIHSAINSLRSQTKLNTSTIDQYCQYLAKEHNAQYIPNCLTDNLATNVAAFPEPTHDKILIPVVLKDWPVDHIVSVYITRDNEGATIEFYDSKGLTIADRLNQPLVNNSQMTLGRLIAELSDRYCDGLTENQITVEENTTKQQWDSHNCGVYVCRYFDARLRGAPTSEIYASQVGYRHTFALRTEMVNDLMPIFNARVLENAPVQNTGDFPTEEELDAAAGLDAHKLAIAKEKEIAKAKEKEIAKEEDILEHSIFIEIAGFNDPRAAVDRSAVVLSDDQGTNVSKKQPVKSSYMQISETLGTRKRTIIHDLEDVDLEDVPFK